jgi:hypothetical protein
LNLSHSEQLSYSTIRIECQYIDGSSGTGTGYFFLLKEDEAAKTHVPVVITNKHVVKNSKQIRFLFTKANSSNEPLDQEHFDIFFDSSSFPIFNHPEIDVDLCAIPIQPFIEEAKNRGEMLFYIPLNKSILPTKEQIENFSAMEEIIMIGYPNGIWDSKNNKPIFRKGVTATHPNFDYNGKKEFLIDAACFPGSSGSPVFIFNEGGYRDKKGNTYMGQSRIILLGTLYAGPQQTTTGEIRVVDVPTSQKAISVSNIPINLGLIIKSERIIELEKLIN